MRLMNVFSSMNISASALTVLRRKMDIIARNLANVDTTKTEKGGPYRREIVTVNEKKATGGFSSILNRFRSQLNTTDAQHIQSRPYPLTNISEAGGVKVKQIVEDNTQPLMVYDPHHPDADEQGYVLKPNINVITEMVDMITATRAYEANLSVIDATKNIVKKSLEI